MSLKRRKKIKKLQKEKQKHGRASVRNSGNRGAQVSHVSSEKFERQKKPVKKVLPGSMRGYICLGGGILMAACCGFLLWSVIMSGADAPGYFGALGLFNMALSVFFIYLGALCLSDKEHAKATARVGIAINGLVVIIYLFLYIIGL